MNVNDKKGYINENGDIVIEPKFDYAWPFENNGLARVEINGKQGYINQSGEMVTELKLDRVWSFENNCLALVRFGYPGRRVHNF